MMANPQELASAPSMETRLISSSHSLSFAAKTHATEREPVKIPNKKEEERSGALNKLALRYDVGVSTKNTHKTLVIGNRKRKEPHTNASEVAVKVEEVSTELKLSNASEVVIKKPKITREVRYLSESERGIRSFTFYSYKDQQEERRLGVSTQLKLFDDPWQIKKTLTRSDTNGLCRLMLKREVVEANIIPFWDADRVAGIESEAGTIVTVWDYDTGSAHQLAFKKWPSNPNCIFNREWSSEFVRRRCLHEGDLIGLFWDANNLRFGFRVLARAQRNQSIRL